MEKQKIRSILDKQVECINGIITDAATIENIIDALVRSRNSGKKIFTMGNGGSASTASHFVSDLLKTAITRNDKRFQAISLADNIPVMLAWSNDTSYDDVFVEQLKNFLSDGDIVIGFSGSGKSKNVVNALKYARKNGALCIGITGMSGGLFPKYCQICLIIPSNNMLTIESMHLMVCHCIIETIRNGGRPMFTYE